MSCTPARQDQRRAGRRRHRRDRDKRTRIVAFDGDRLELDDLTADLLALEVRADGLSPFRVPEWRIEKGELVDLVR